MMYVDYQSSIVSGHFSRTRKKKLMQSTLKFHSKSELGFQNDGPLNMIVAQRNLFKQGASTGCYERLYRWRSWGVIPRTLLDPKNQRKIYLIPDKDYTTRPTSDLHT